MPVCMSGKQQFQRRRDRHFDDTKGFPFQILEKLTEIIRLRAYMYVSINDGQNDVFINVSHKLEAIINRPTFCNLLKNERIALFYIILIVFTTN